MTPKIAVILFPGTNCELEALRACDRSGMRAELFRWNEDSKKLKTYDGLIIPGGFSYEDRGRSGVIASKDPIMEVIRHEAEKGKPVLGICNGAQILVEAKIIPGLNTDQLQMGIAWNERIKKGQLLGVGFYNEWIYIRSDAKPRRTPFNRFGSKVVIRCPVANGEGRYTSSKEVLKELIKNDQTVFRFCDAEGKISADFPVNPNGAMYNIAGVCNPAGNVMSLMPHPERNESGQPIFDSIADFLGGSRKSTFIKTAKSSIKPPAEKPLKRAKKADIIITVKLIITDNEERTIENTLKNIGFKDLKLRRKIYYGIDTQSQSGLKNLATKIIESGELVNLNKEVPTVEISGKSYRYKKEGGLFEETPEAAEHSSYMAAEMDNYLGKNVLVKLQKYFKNAKVKNVERGVIWNVSLKKEKIDNLLKTHIFHNPGSMTLTTLND